jgi:predicted lipoprotein
MSAMVDAARPPRRSRGKLVAIGVAALLVAGIAFDTKVVAIGSEQDVRADVFSPEAFGAEQFPAIQAFVEGRAVPAADLAAQLAADQAGASAAHGVKAGVGYVMPVSFTGVVGEGKAGVFPVTVEGLPEGVMVRVQTGPAINGTELRDATGEIAFGQFKNQIEYQDAGSAINNAMKAAVLADVDTKALTGKTVVVTGAFTLINPKNWLVTPVRFEVQ